MQAKWASKLNPSDCRMGDDSSTSGISSSKTKYFTSRELLWRIIEERFFIVKGPSGVCRVVEICALRCAVIWNWVPELSVNSILTAVCGSIIGTNMPADANNSSRESQSATSSAPQFSDTKTGILSISLAGRRPCKVYGCWVSVALILILKFPTLSLGWSLSIFFQ